MEDPGLADRIVNLGPAPSVNVIQAFAKALERLEERMDRLEDALFQ